MDVRTEMDLIFLFSNLGYLFLLLTFVFSVLSCIFWNAAVSKNERIKSEAITPKTLIWYNSFVRKEHRDGLPMEEWKPVRGLYGYWRDHYPDKDISEFWRWVRNTKKQHPYMYGELMDHNSNIPA